MIVYITRHGQIDPRGDSPIGYQPLSALGRRQAERLGQWLARSGFRGTILASPYLRCLETADIICRQLELKFYAEPAIREIAGPWIEKFRGLDHDEIRKSFATCATDMVIPYPWWTGDLETHDDVLRRVGVFLDSYLPNAATDILLVGHGATAEAAFEHITGRNDFPDGYYNCALSAVQLRPNRSVLYANLVEHLTRGEVTSNERIIA